ncbi:L-arabinose transport system permease protein AraQ [subsurface metagenome]
MRQYIYSIPDDLINAARIDGCSEIGVFLRIILPVIKPAIGAVVIVNFMYAWNWFLWPLVVLQSNDKFTMNLGLHFIRWLEMGAGENPTDYGALMAISFLYTMPFIVFYLIFQRFFVESITLTGLKE